MVLKTSYLCEQADRDISKAMDAPNLVTADCLSAGPLFVPLLRAGCVYRFTAWRKHLRKMNS